MEEKESVNNRQKSKRHSIKTKQDAIDDISCLTHKLVRKITERSAK